MRSSRVLAWAFVMACHVQLPSSSDRLGNDIIAVIAAVRDSSGGMVIVDSMSKIRIGALNARSAGVERVDSVRLGAPLNDTCGVSATKCIGVVFLSYRQTNDVALLRVASFPVVVGRCRSSYEATFTLRRHKHRSYVADISDVDYGHCGPP
jgi:hypothetical protein